MPAQELITKLVNAQTEILDRTLAQIKLNERRARNAAELGDEIGAQTYAVAASAQEEIFNIINNIIGGL